MLGRHRPGGRHVGQLRARRTTSATRGPGWRPTGLRSVTVVGPGLAFTDAYATALFVMGLDGLAWLDTRGDYAALAITGDDRMVWTPGMERYLVR